MTSSRARALRSVSGSAFARAVIGTSSLIAALALPVAAHSEPNEVIPVVDLAQDLATRTVDGAPALNGHNGQAALLRLRQGGLFGVVLPLHEPHPGRTSEVSAETAYLDLQRSLTEPGPFHLPGCHRSGARIDTWLSLDGAAELAQSPTKVALWVTRGVRIFRLTGSADNELAASFMHPNGQPDAGLSSRGAEVVRRIYAASGVVDIGSLSTGARRDVLALAAALHAPVVAIAANARAMADDPRNLLDPELRAVAASGGVVAASFDENRIVRGRTATLHDLVRQIRYLATVAGIEHVALASGYEATRPPDGLETAARFPALARALLASGMSRGDVERIFHRNALRVLCPSAASNRP